MSRGHSAGKFPGSGPDQIPSLSVFKFLIKACFNLIKMELGLFLLANIRAKSERRGT